MPAFLNCSWGLLWGYDNFLRGNGGGRGELGGGPLAPLPPSLLLLHTPPSGHRQGTDDSRPTLVWGKGFGRWAPAAELRKPGHAARGSGSGVTDADSPALATQPWPPIMGLQPLDPGSSHVAPAARLWLRYRALAVQGRALTPPVLAVRLWVPTPSSGCAAPVPGAKTQAARQQALIPS